MIGILIVDDHRMFREGIRTRLAQHPRFQVVGEAANAEEALAVMRDAHPAIVVLDIRMPGVSGIELARRLRADWPEVKILVLSGYDFDQYVRALARIGIHGYLLKEIDEENLVQAIRNVAAGRSILDPAVTRRVLERVKNTDSNSETPSTNRLGSLSSQERRVLALVAEGKTNKEIGHAIGLSDKTVKNYLSNIMEKLQVARRSQAAAYFVQHSAR